MPDRAAARTAARETRQVLQEELDVLLQEKRHLQTRAGIAYAVITRGVSRAQKEIHVSELEEIKAKQTRVNAEAKTLRSQIRALEQQIRRDEGRLIRKGGATQ